MMVLSFNLAVSNHQISEEVRYMSSISISEFPHTALMKIFYSTHRYPEKEQGRNIITQIIYQLSDEVLRGLCSDSKLLGVIEDSDKTTYEYLCNKGNTSVI